MKRSYDSDPAWSRTSITRQKRKMLSRAALQRLKLQVRKKREADKGKVRTFCVTRTVELPDTQTIGNEKNKLLFMVAIGLVPNVDKTRQNYPFVKIERLDRTVEAKTKAKTKERLFEILEARKREDALQRHLQRYKSSLSTPGHWSSSYRIPISVPEPEEDDDVEVVNLISSDEGSDPDLTISDTEIDIATKISYVTSAYRKSVRRPSSSDNSSIDSNSGSYKIITSTPRPRNPVFKPLLNNQNNGIFSNWKPESMSRLLNLGEGGAEKKGCNTSLKDSQSKLLSSLKALPSSASTLTVRNFSPSMLAGGHCKSHVHGSGEDTSSSSGVSELDFNISPTVITID